MSAKAKDGSTSEEAGVKDKKTGPAWIAAIGSIVCGVVALLGRFGSATALLGIYGIALGYFAIAKGGRFWSKILGALGILWGIFNLIYPSLTGFPTLV